MTNRRKAQINAAIMRMVEIIENPLIYLISALLLPYRAITAKIAEKRSIALTMVMNHLKSFVMLFFVAELYAKMIVNVVAEVLKETSASR